MSDLHCQSGQPAHQESFLLSGALRSPVHKHPIQSLLTTIARERLSADCLLVPGDLTHQIDQAGLVAGWQFAKEIASALGVASIATTLGNHDVDSRHRSGPDAFQIAKNLAPDYPTADGQEQSSYWSDGFCIVDSPAVRVVVVNSVAGHLDEVTAMRGSVSEETLDKIDARLRDIAPHARTVALVHHHPIAHEDTDLSTSDLLLGGATLLELLSANGIRLVIHGHKHYPRLRYFDAGSSKVVVFAAGSFSATSANFLNTTNLFHIIELPDETLANCTMLGRIESWEYTYGRGWKPAHLRSADIPSVAGFGCSCETEDMARSIADFVTNVGGPVVRWNRVVREFPQIQYLMPTQFAAVGKRLRETHLLQMMPDYPEPPENIVRVSLTPESE